VRRSKIRPTDRSAILVAELKHVFLL